jgi:hypothetical protein
MGKCGGKSKLTPPLFFRAASGYRCTAHPKRVIMGEIEGERRGRREEEEREGERRGYQNL